MIRPGPGGASLLAIALAGAWAVELAAQAGPSDPLGRVIVEVEHGAEAFARQRDAIATGYRRVGTDFPGMGEHWVLPVALFAGRVDPAHPSLLVYAEIGGTPRLVGAGFIVPVRGDSGPTGLPGWPEAWHEHSGLLADESGAAVGRGPPKVGGTRIWVMHVWTGLPNPDGVNEADNWALPFARAGFPPPVGAEIASGRAMSLTVGGDAYLRDLLGDVGLRSMDNAVAVDSAIARARARADAVAGRAHARGAIGPTELAELRAGWDSLTVELRGILGTHVERYLSGTGLHAH